MRKVLGNGIFEVRRSKERCPEHQIAGLVHHCPREIFKQIAGVLGLVCHPAKGFLGNLCFMLLDSKDCDRLLALKQDMLILVMMMAAVPAAMIYKSDSPGSTGNNDVLAEDWASKVLRHLYLDFYISPVHMFL